jgi:2',3'-cyclic-nucleotide 2'-phosphodiesterase (5'-nucleotidase family)
MKKFILSFFVLILLQSCKNEPQHLIKIEGKLLPVSSEITEKSNIDNFIEPYKEKVEKEMNKILSFTPVDLNRYDGELESSLGSLMADLCFERANPIFLSRTKKNIDFSLFNFGGIRAGITKGNVTTEHAFQLMPFENSLVVVELSAKKMNELINYLISQNRAHPISKHVKLEINKDSHTFKLNNKEIDNSKTYFVLTSDYLQNGGDSMNFFKDPINLYKLDYKVRNSIIDYFSETDTLKIKLDGRFKKTEW